MATNQHGREGGNHTSGDAQSWTEPAPDGHGRGNHGGFGHRRNLEPSAMNGAGNHARSDTHHRVEPDAFTPLALKAKQAAEAEHTSVAFQQYRQSLLKDAADNELVRTLLWHMDEMESAAKKLARGLKRQLAALCPDPRVVAFVDDTTGLGSACHFFLGLLPNWIADFQTVSKLWAYCGLHVVDGRAPKREKGRRANWSSRLKSIAIVYLAEPCMKHRASPYRGVYELRRAHTAEMHPSPDPESCEACQKAAKETRHRKKQGKTGSLDCARYGGPHWTDGHAHKDALRVTAKAIVKDLWRVSRGQDPLFGGATRLAAPPILRLEPAGQRSTSRETIAPSLSKATPNPGTQPTVATTPMPNYQGLREATDNP